MLSANEIYLLNESLDGSDIYGIYKEAALIENISSKKNVVESLIEKKVINEDNTINSLSYLIIKSLEKFKKAKSYLWVNDILLSEDNSDFMILMRKDNELNEFEIKKTTNFHLMLSLLKNYDFLNEENKNRKYDSTLIPVNDFIEEYITGCNNEECLILRREANTRIPYVTNYVTYVMKNDKVYRYNVLKEELSEIGSKDARIEISKLLRLEVDKNE